MSENVQSAEAPDKNGALKEIVEIVKTVLYALAIALFLRIVFFQPFTIPSASMEPNLYEGDYIIVSKFSYGYSRHSIPFSPPIFNGRVMAQKARRGDIVVFKLPSDGHTDYVKRVIGVAGDRIQMKDSRLYVNDREVERAQLSPVKSEIPTIFAPHATRARAVSLPTLPKPWMTTVVSLALMPMSVR